MESTKTDRRRTKSSCDSLVSRWFYAGVFYSSGKPEFVYSARGFRLNGRMVYALLATTDDVNIRTTDAEAILANFLFFPGAQRLKRVFSQDKGSVVLTVHPWYILLYGFSGLVKRLDQTAASGLYAGRWLSNAVLKRICSESSLPVICATGPKPDEITSRIRAGAYALCLKERDISKKLVLFLHEAYPHVPVIASCGRSGKEMLNSVKAGVDAVIFQPCVLLAPEFLSCDTGH